MAQDSAERVLAAADQQAQAILAQAHDRAAVSPQVSHAACREELERQVEEFNAFIADHNHRLQHSLQAQVSQLQKLLDEFTTLGEPVAFGDAVPRPPSPPRPMATGHPAGAHSATGRHPAPTPPTQQPAGPQACAPADGPDLEDD
ncbi:hypothetical protein ACFQX6_09780 [Streptosporangium lutulentum]